MGIFCVDLTDECFTLLPSRNKSGLALAIELYKEFGENAIVIAAPTERSVRYMGSSNFNVVFHSPISNSIEFGYSNLPPGFSLFRLGYEALIIKGRSTKLSYISLYSATSSILPCEYLRGKSAEAFDEVATNNMTDTTLATGRAADNGVKFASLICKGRALSCDGLGYVFAQMNLKGIVLQGFDRKDNLAKGKDAIRFTRTIEKSKLARRIRKNGANCFIDDALRLGWIPVDNNTRRFDPRAYFLNGESFASIYGNYPDSCQECFLACGRRQKDNKRLPSWQECIALGSNLGFYDPASVLSLVSAANEEGLDVSHLGALLSYVSRLKKEDLEVLLVSNHSVDEYVRLIHSIGESRGVGAIFREGLKSFPDALQTSKGEAVCYDLRGCFPEALAVSLGLDIVLPASMMLPKKSLSAKCSAIMAFYEICYTLALLCYGFAPVVTACMTWDRIPSLFFSSPFLLRLYARHYSVYGFRSRELLKTGLEVMGDLGLEFNSIPSIFEMSPNSSKDATTVPLVRLQSLFLSEKAKAEMTLKSRRDTTSKESVKNNPAVAPKEDLGLDGDPGLNK